MIKVAVIGLGKMGLLHSSILNVLENSEVVALCEKSWMVRRYASKIIPGISLVANVEQLAEMGPDAVYVTTPQATHYPIIKTIYNKKIACHVFVEKPLATTYAEARELYELASPVKGINMVGYNRRFSVTFGHAKQIVENGVLGELVSFEGHAFSSDFRGANLGTPSSARAGALGDLGCHVIDLSLWLFEPIEANSGLLDLNDNDKPVDWVRFKIRSLENHAPLEGELKISRCMENYRLPEMALDIKGTKGSVKVDEDKVTLELNNGESSLWHKHNLSDYVPFFIGGTEYVREDACFINAIANGTVIESDFRAASRVEAIIEQVMNRAGELQTA